MPQHREAVLRQVLTVAAMRAAEQALIDGGETVDSLMERAGRGAGEWVRRLASGRAVTVLCGPGNNGGDGYVIARHCAEHGLPVRVIVASAPSTPACRAARARFEGEVLGPDAAPHGEVFVDCMLGSGLSRPLGDGLCQLLGRLATHHGLRVAVDLPSGVDADSGEALNVGLPPYDVTLALGAWKPAHWTMPAAATMGALRLVDIGVGEVPAAPHLLARPAIRPPAPYAHKYRRGLLAIVAGAMPGAVLLAATAAMRAGAGYVRLLADVPPAGLPADLVCSTDWPAAVADPRIAALLVGPGLGRDAAARQRLDAVLQQGRPVVLDADALVLLDRPVPAGVQAILTPHEGEMAALERAFGLPGTGPRRNRAQALAERSGAVVLFKGPDSLVAAPGRAPVLAPRASSWLSVAGSGDVLAGIAASRLAVHGEALIAACEALWLHGEAARLAGPAFTPGELARHVGCALATTL